MSVWSSALRLGSTSYVYPGDVLPNVRRLSGLVQDVEWVVFELSYGLPPASVIAEMARLGRDYGHSYTVHLPLDLALAAEDEGVRRQAVETARRVIAAARPLAPWAYVVHVGPLETGEAPGAADIPWGAWHERAAGSLLALGREVGDLGLLAVENTTGYRPEVLSPLCERLPVSVCLDVGHLLRQGRDPLRFVEAWGPRLRAVHLHGVEDGRDHRTLATMDQGLLKELLGRLRHLSFGGVVTLELFNAEAFLESWELVEALWRRTWP